MNVNPESVNDLAVAGHAIEPSILLASKHVHREAYDTMIKTNRFVRVTSSAGIPLRLLLNHLQVPVVAEKKEYIDSFPGCVLSISLTCSKDMGNRFRQTPFSTEPCSLLLLGRDMDVFCDTLMDGDVHVPNFGTQVGLKIAVAPGSILASVSYRDSISEFFSDKTQQVLLEPFRARLRGFKKVKVRGLVDRATAEAVENELAQDTASDPEVVVSNFQNAKDEGQKLYKAKRTDEACLMWQDAALEIELLHQGSSWGALTKKGGVPFAARLAEIYFLMKLNVAHIKLNGMERGEFFADCLAKDALGTAMQSLRQDHWMPGLRWQPTDVHKAKLQYRYALFFRLEGDPQSINIAVAYIEKAHRLLPNDVKIGKERDTVLAWRDALR